MKPLAEMTRDEWRAYQRDFRRAMGLRIRGQRQRLGWTQAQLASAAACSATGISVIESGTREIWAGRLLEIARALGVAPSSLLPSP